MKRGRRSHRNIFTPRQLEIMKYLRDSRRQNGYSPTLQEIADHLGISKVTVFEHVEALIKKGVVSREDNKARSLELTAAARLPDERPTLLPLVGRIAAGAPIDVVEDQESVDLETIFTSRYPVGVLTVTGDSMIEDSIRDGDMVVFEQRQSARNGDTVVALVRGDEATLKRYHREKDRIRLEPANAAYKPIVLKEKEVQIQGVVIGVIRRM